METFYHSAGSTIQGLALALRVWQKSILWPSEPGPPWPSPPLSSSRIKCRYSVLWTSFCSFKTMLLSHVGIHLHQPYPGPGLLTSGSVSLRPIHASDLNSPVTLSGKPSMTFHSSSDASVSRELSSFLAQDFSHWGYYLINVCPHHDLHHQPIKSSE